MLVCSRDDEFGDDDGMFVVLEVFVVVIGVVVGVIGGRFRFNVGGITPVIRLIIVKADSTAPAAPSRCPVAPLVDDTYNGEWRNVVDKPKTEWIAFTSAKSPTGVDVACALIYPMCSGKREAQDRAESIARAAPSPVSGGEVI